MYNLICTRFVFDLEVTNLCNTACAFCPREAMQRPKGRMNQETLDLYLKRLKTYVQRLAGQTFYSLPARERKTEWRRHNRGT